MGKCLLKKLRAIVPIPDLEVNVEELFDKEVKEAQRERKENETIGGGISDLDGNKRGRPEINATTEQYK